MVKNIMEVFQNAKDVDLYHSRAMMGSVRTGDNKVSYL